MMLNLIIALLFSSSSKAANPSGYAVSQTENLLMVKTPWGQSLYIAPVGFDAINNYSFEIPLSDFRTTINKNMPPAQSGESSLANSSDLSADVDVLISEANRLYNEAEFTKSLQYVDQICLRDPKNIRAWVMKGSLMHVLGHKDLAKQAWQKAAELDPNNLQLQNILKEMK